eukprot:Stramenopile-MAST_4_protein_1221
MTGMGRLPTMICVVFCAVVLFARFGSAASDRSLSKRGTLQHSAALIAAVDAGNSEDSKIEAGDAPSVGALEQVLSTLTSMKATARKEQVADEDSNIARASRCRKERLKKQKKVTDAQVEISSFVSDEKYLNLIGKIHIATKTAMKHYRTADNQAKALAPSVMALKHQVSTLKNKIQEKEDRENFMQNHLTKFGSRVKEAGAAKVGDLIKSFSSELKGTDESMLKKLRAEFALLNSTYNKERAKLNQYEHTMNVALKAVDHATKASRFLKARHDSTIPRRNELMEIVKENAEDLKFLNGECEAKKVEFLQRHSARNEELDTMASLVQYLHQQLVVQQRKLASSIELLKSGNLN